MTTVRYITIVELSQLPDEQLRVMCAERMGWQRLENSSRDRIWLSDENTDTHGFMMSPGTSAVGTRPPNYPASLDAMAKAEKTLTDEQWTDFVQSLRKIYLCELSLEYRDRFCDASLFLQSSARQRCIAFLVATQPQ